MAKRTPVARIQKGALSAEEAERLFSTVDDTGHTNEETAKKQRKNRKKTGHAVDIDPLSAEDPSGSNVEKVITKTAVGFVIIFLAAITIAQVGYGFVRRMNTANLSENATVSSVASALSGGVEWGNGFTQFPEDFTVQEADENTHRIEVTVVDTNSDKALDLFAGSQIQASAFAVNALLNPNINTVIYRVQVHVDANGNYETSKFFGFLQPTGEIKTMMTFVWTKTQTDTGVQFNCTITGLDNAMQEALRDNITSTFTPTGIISYVLGGSSDSSSTSDNSSSSANSNSSTSDKSSNTTDTSTSEQISTDTSTESAG